PPGTYNYVDSTGWTPAPYNGTQDRRCWYQDLLPYTDQEAIGRRFEAYMNTGASALGFPNLDAVVKSFYCPSHPASPKTFTYWGGFGTPTQGFSGNYVACSDNKYTSINGDYTTSAKCNGMFYAQSKVRFTDVTDGQTYTLMFSEIILGEDYTGHDIR